jgi:uncharacterized protein (DUF3084 family)
VTARPEIRSSLSQHAARQRLCGLKLHKPCLNKAASPVARHDYIEQEDVSVRMQSGRWFFVVIAIVGGSWCTGGDDDVGFVSCDSCHATQLQIPMHG